MQRVTTPDGNTVAVHDLGGEGPPLLMAHATGFHGHVWDPVATQLSHRFHCVAFDERGHGDSDPAPGENYDWNGFATDALAVIDALGLGADEPLRAVGHSCGGALLLLAEERRPGTFAKLWVYEPVMVPMEGLPTLPDGKNPLADGARRRRASFDSKQAAYDNYASKPPFNILEADALWAYVEHGFREKGDGVTLKCEPEREARTYEASFFHQAFAHLPEVETPVTVVCGELTDAFPEPVIRMIAERLPHGTAGVLPGLGHFGPLQDPGAIAQSIETALG